MIGTLLAFEFGVQMGVLDRGLRSDNRLEVRISQILGPSTNSPHCPQQRATDGKRPKAERAPVNTGKIQARVLD